MSRSSPGGQHLIWNILPLAEGCIPSSARNDSRNSTAWWVISTDKGMMIKLPAEHLCVGELPPRGRVRRREVVVKKRCAPYLDRSRIASSRMYRRPWQEQTDVRSETRSLSSTPLDARSLGKRGKFFIPRPHCPCNSAQRITRRDAIDHRPYGCRVDR